MIIRRTYNCSDVDQATYQYAPEISDFDPYSWLEHRENIALIREDTQDISLFERQNKVPTAVHGHYFFHSRGKEAYLTAVEMLDEIFRPEYKVEIVIGLTPTDHKGALWMNRRLGFKSHGVIDTEAGPHEFVVMTKEEWENTRNE